MSATIAGFNILADTGMVRPLRNYPPLTIKPPGQGNPPQVAMASGLGDGGGAFVTADSDAAQGIVIVQVGRNPLTTGTIILTFPGYPVAFPAGGFVILASWATLTITPLAPDLTAAWSLPTQDFMPWSRHRIAYQWATAD